jgi:hypothetical protein
LLHAARRDLAEVEDLREGSVPALRVAFCVAASTSSPPWPLASVRNMSRATTASVSTAGEHRQHEDDARNLLKSSSTTNKGESDFGSDSDGAGCYRMVTNSSALVGWMATQLSKSACM